MSLSKIEWTDRTWNPVRGCTRVSPGCQHCYAEVMAARQLPGHNSPTTGEPFARMTKGGPRWTGAVEFLPHKLAEPLSWRKPARVFVNSMSDLFHEELSFEEIAAVFGVMAACPHLEFQILTKRPGVATQWYWWIQQDANRLRREVEDRLLGGERSLGDWTAVSAALQRLRETNTDAWVKAAGSPSGQWPLPNVRLGVSVEDQATADERIPLLLRCPAAIRFVSYEPALGPVDFRNEDGVGGDYDWLTGEAYEWSDGTPRELPPQPALDWIIVGGESGPGARPFDVAWARETVRQCQEAGVPVFVKQLGARPVEAGCEPGYVWIGQNPQSLYRVHHPKGGDPAEWPEDLRVREFPEVSP